MSGTRKMEKFEVDAYNKTRGTDPPPSSKNEQAEREAAAAIAEISPNAIEALAPDDDLPARPFDQRREPQAAFAELPAVPFEQRRAPEQPGVTEPTDLPARTFERSDLPARAFEPRAGGGDAATAEGAAAAGPAAGVAGEKWEPGEWVPPQATEGASSSTEPLPGEDADALRTRLARKFISLADSVGEAFREFAIGGGAWAVELTAPQGMSTGGGKQALQHLRLRPRRDGGYSTLVAGTVNQVEKRAELRDFDHVTILHEVRFRNALEISSQEWEQFLRKAEVVLNGAGIQSMRTPPPRELLEQRRNMQRVSKGAIAALIVVLLLATVVVWRVAVALSAQQ